MAKTIFSLEALESCIMDDFKNGAICHQWFSVLLFLWIVKGEGKIEV